MLDYNLLQLQEVSATTLSNEPDMPWLWLHAIPNDTPCTVIKIQNTNDLRLVASAVLIPATDSDLTKRTNLKPQQLTNSAYLAGLYIDPDMNHEGLLNLILYFTFRRARIWHCENVLLEQHPASRAASQVIKAESLDYCNCDELLSAQEVNFAMTLLTEQCSQPQRAFIQSHFIAESVEQLKNWLNGFYQSSWAQAIVNKKISKQQYVSSLCNMHQFVRYTTRLIARAIAYSDNNAIRDHWLYHIQGEINHERIIERDLQYFGVDVEYVKTQQVPHWSVKRFLAIQDSTIGFHCDPVLFLANPFIAEAMTAHLQPEFMSALHERIQDWGYAEPKKGCAFLSSHIHTDGGEDGHWLRVKKMVQQFITDEYKQQQFLTIMRAASDAYATSFNACIDSQLLWSDPSNIA